MNIVLFTDTYAPELNGVATSVSTLAKLLKDRGHEVTVVTTNPFSKEVTFEDGVIRVPGIKLKWCYDYILAPTYNRKALSLLKKIKPDIIHVHTDFGIAQIAFTYSRYCKVPIVYTYHTMYEDYTYYITKGKIDRLSKWIMRQYSLSTLEKASGIIAPSVKSMNYLRRAGSDNSFISVVPTGVDTKRFLNYQLDLNKKEEFLKRVNIPSGSKIMLFLGRLAKEKNVEELLVNFKEAKEKYPNLYFIIVGDGPNRANLEKLATELELGDKCKFTGAVPYSEIDFYYSVCDFFAAASTSETQGLTYLEAMASRRIVLAKFDTNLSELIQDDENGYFFEEKSEFIEKIGKIINISPTYYNMLEKNMIESVERLSLDVFYNKIIKVYERAKRNTI